MGAKDEVEQGKRPNQQDGRWKTPYGKLPKEKEADQQDGWWDGLFRRLCRVRRACCCSLHTGTLVIGWLYVVAATFTTLAMVFSAAIQLDWIWLNPKTLNENEKLEAYHTTLAFIVMAVAVAMAVVSVLLLVGAYSGNMLFVRIWLQANVVLFVVRILLGITNFVVQVGLNDAVQKMMGSLALVVVLELIFVYVIIVVKSYYVEQVDAKK